MVMKVNKKYEISEEIAKEIRTKIKKYKKTTAYTKLQTIMLAGEGTEYKEIAKITGYHYNHVKILIKEYCINGFDKFVEDKRKGGNHCNLAKEEEVKLLDKYKEEAENGQIITPMEIKKDYDKAIGRKSGVSTFYGFLKRNNWRKVKPRGQHPKKASEEDIEASKKLKIL